jgi:hypothetical protein
MSISINNVYQKVLAIANKEQRGYITPQEFNLFADQAQKEIFEQYFYDINQFNRVPGNQTEFSDQLYMLEEKIAPFRVNNVSMLSTTELLTTSTFEAGAYTPWIDGTGNNTAPAVFAEALNGWVTSVRLINDGSDSNPLIRQNITLSTSKSYRLKVKVSYAKETPQEGESGTDSVGLRINVEPTDVNSSGDGRYLIFDTVETGGEYFLDFKPIDTSGSSGTEPYKIEVGLAETVLDNTVIHFSEISLKEVDNTTLATDIYRLGEVLYTHSGSTYPTTVQEVSTSELTNYNLSPLAKPTYNNPIYVRSTDTSINIYPNTLNGDIKYNYVKMPNNPKWTYNVVLGKAVYNASAADAKDFELHPSEENNLVYKILQLAGVSMRDSDIAQAGSNKEIQELQQQKS